MAAEQSLWAGPTTVSPPEPSRFSQWLEGTWRSKGHRPLREDNGNEQPITELHTDLDNILDKLQEMLASNFSLAGQSVKFSKALRSETSLKFNQFLRSFIK